MQRSNLLTNQQLANLAPLQLPFYRHNRYSGDDSGIVLADFTLESQHTIRGVYAAMLELLALCTAYKDQTLPRDGLKQLLDAAQWSHLMHQLQHLEASHATTHHDQVNEVMHDVRGGGCAALSINLQLIALDIVDLNDTLRVFFLTRDHLKIMRSAIRDLDPPRYEADYSQKLHNVKLIVEKWTDAVHKYATTSAHVSVDCQFDGNISERCLEFAALDRVLYNVLNNAVRHTADETVHLAIFSLAGEHPHDVRFVVYNAITAAHQHILQAKFGSDINRLFAGGFTTGGTGLGMHICAQFVTNAYGLGSPKHALAERHLGAKIIDEQFVVWFHWPIAAD